MDYSSTAEAASARKCLSLRSSFVAHKEREERLNSSAASAKVPGKKQQFSNKIANYCIPYYNITLTYSDLEVPNLYPSASVKDTNLDTLVQLLTVLSNALVFKTFHDISLSFVNNGRLLFITHANLALYILAVK